MIDPKTLEQLMHALRQALPAGLGQDVEKNLRAALSATLARLDLVTREELEVQTQVLARTRARLEALEKQVAELERQQRR
jgi:BMFP domain-containing protein YqiC